MSKGIWKKHEETRQYIIYREYITTNKSLDTLAEEFGVSKGCISQCIYNERKQQGLIKKRK